MFFEKRRLDTLKQIFGDMFYEKTNSLSKKIDSFVLHSHLSLPIFFALMYGIFQLTFTVGGYFADMFDTFFISFQEYLR